MDMDQMGVSILMFLFAGALLLYATLMMLSQEDYFLEAFHAAEPSFADFATAEPRAIRAMTLGRTIR